MIFVVEGPRRMAEVFVDEHDYNKILPACPNCSCLEQCKYCLLNKEIVTKCIWYGWLKENFKSLEDKK